MSVLDEMLGQTKNWVKGHRLQDLPNPKLTPALAAKWLVDEWALQLESTNSRLRAPSISKARRSARLHRWQQGAP